MKAATLSLAGAEAPPRAGHRVMRSLGLLLRLWALMPVFALATLGSFVLRARIVTGAWPRPYHPDPASLEAPLHLGFTWLVQLGAVGAPLMVLLVLAMRAAVGRRARTPWIDLGLLAVTSAAWWAVMVFDPGHALEWLAD